MADNSSFKSEWYKILDKDLIFKNPIKHLKKKHAFKKQNIMEILFD